MRVFSFSNFVIITTVILKIKKSEKKFNDQPLLRRASERYISDDC